MGEAFSDGLINRYKMSWMYYDTNFIYDYFKIDHFESSIEWMLILVKILDFSTGYFHYSRFSSMFWKKCVQTTRLSGLKHHRYSF